MSRRPALLAAVAVATGVLAAPAHAAPAAPLGNLVNLAHLDFLRTAVTPPAQAGHTTYQLDRDPSVGFAADSVMQLTLRDAR